jgi:hypothetical protein
VLALFSWRTCREATFKKFVLERELADQTLESRDARLIVCQHIGGGRVAVEPLSLVLGDPDLDQVAADSVALGERVGRVSA